ncbi:hypothetical protein HK096_002749, partial [Nowakowskiella sp. JEL0078]
MRIVKYADQYLITFSLLNSDPRASLVSWDIGTALDVFIQPILQRLENISSFIVNSQIQHFATLNLKPEVRFDESGKLFSALPASLLPMFINSAEWNFASAISTSSPINFVLYIPSRNEPPLHLVKMN